MTLIMNCACRNTLNSNFRLLMSYRNIQITQAQNLYSLSTLGIDGYLQSRKRTKEQFHNFLDKFKTKIDDFVNDSKNMIYTEDLKNMIHLAEPSDLQLILNMIKKFNTQNTEFRFGTFIFGPVAMRMFHFLDAPNEALQAFEDPSNDGFFDQLITYQILLDLLYIHEMYDEMFRVFDKIQEKQINMTKFPKYPVVLVLAACYKQNTPQSLEYASKLWTEMTKVGTVPLRRATTFFAALALKQGAPHRALESLSSQKQHYVTIRNIKAAALADMGRNEDAIAILRSILDIDAPEQKDKHTFFDEIVVKVRESVMKNGNKDLQKEFNDVEKALRDRQLIDTQTIDKLLNAEINPTVKKADQYQRTLMYQNKKMPFSQRNRIVPNNRY